MKKKKEMRSSSNNFLNFVFDTQDAWFVLKISNNVMELCVFFKKNLLNYREKSSCYRNSEQKKLFKKMENYYIVH